MASAISVTGRNVKVTPGIKSYIEKRFDQRIRSHNWGNINSASFVLSVERGLHIVEATVDVDGFVIHAEESSPDMYGTIDLLMDVLEKQLRRHHDKMVRRKVEPRDRKFSMTAYIYESHTEKEPYKTKSFSFKPLTFDEAVLQLEMVSTKRGIFFITPDDGTLNLVYREDGRYRVVIFKPLEKLPFMASLQGAISNALSKKEEGVWYPTMVAYDKGDHEVKLKKSSPKFVPVLSSSEVLSRLKRRDYLVFIDSESGLPALAYRRKNGDLGIVLPQ